MQSALGLATDFWVMTFSWNSKGPRRALWFHRSLTAAGCGPALPVGAKAPSAVRSCVIYSCKYVLYTTYSRSQVLLKISCFFGFFRLGVQNEAITAAVQLAPHVRAPAAVVDLIAVADVEARLGAVPPNRVLHEPRKQSWETSD